MGKPLKGHQGQDLFQNILMRVAELHLIWEPLIISLIVLLLLTLNSSGYIWLLSWVNLAAWILWFSLGRLLLLQTVKVTTLKSCWFVCPTFPTSSACVLCFTGKVHMPIKPIGLIEVWEIFIMWVWKNYLHGLNVWTEKLVDMWVCAEPVCYLFL